MRLQWHLLCSVLAWGASIVLFTSAHLHAEETPYCTAPKAQIEAWLEQQLTSAKTPWEMRAVLIGESKAIIACFVEVRDAAFHGDQK